MSDLGVARFGAFFQELWGYEPFPWQAALAQRVLTRKDAPWPGAIAVPTSAGKTACLDVAIFALAASVGTGTRAPRRIWFVVDRRVIVDEAHERAKRVCRQLGEARGGVAREVADRLREVSGGGPPLAAHLLRGGVYRDDAWARSPLQPAVISSTVDQFGSRLLFRAYGRSSKAWPIQAGLAGNDSLVLLDEAHCSRPFLETLRAVSRYRSLAADPLPAPFHAVVLSATPPGDVADRHDLSPADRGHPVLGRRLTASKPARLLPPIAAKGGGGGLAETLAREARALIDADAGRLAIVVFCNRVATAKGVHDLLAKNRQDHDVVLLTGRMRPIDKDDVVEMWLARLSAGAADSRRLDRPVIVVATQTLEVGANLDFDGLASECASLDALRQRMGRLNRTGRDIVARASLAVAEEQSEKSDDDPVYGAALAKTWQWLRDRADANEEVDFGIQALGALLPPGDDLDLLNAPARHAPVLLPAHLDAWAQTAPIPWPSPDPALFLHGPERGAADVQVCWRADLPNGDPGAWADALALCPPTAAECLAVPFGRMRAWLRGEAEAPDVGDVEGAGDQAAEDDGRRQSRTSGVPRRALRWFGRDDFQALEGPDALRPGDVLVVPAQDGGFDMLGHRPPGVPLDRGDEAHREARGKAVLRLHPAAMAEWPIGEAKGTLATLAQDSGRREEDFDGWLQDLRTALEELGAAELPAGWDWLGHAAKELASDKALGRLAAEHPAGGVVLRGSRRLRPDADGGFTDEDDATASGTCRVELADHLRRVGERARRHGAALSLPAPLVDAMAAAGAGHDLGKADPRFQGWLHGGRPATGPLLAKSSRLPQNPLASRRARERAGYPRGGRHELLSVRLLEAAGLDKGADLVRHLVESHHGHARPFAPVVVDPDPLDVQHPSAAGVTAHTATGLERLDSGVAERFWRLTRRYGWWGLAWLETLVRLADHLESAEEQA